MDSLRQFDNNSTFFDIGIDKKIDNFATLYCVMSETKKKRNDITKLALRYLLNDITLSNDEIAIAKTISKSTGFFDYYTHWDYIPATGSSSLKFNASSVNNPQADVASYKSLPIGSYRIYCLNGSNLQSGTDYIDEPIGINIAPAATLGAKVGSTSILSTSSPYDISSVNKTVTVTAADVETGYITVSFNFGSLAANTTYFLNVQNVSLNK